MRIAYIIASLTSYRRIVRPRPAHLGDERMMPNRGPSAWRRYLRFWGTDPARDLDDELRFHLEARYDEYVAGGMRPDIARAEAERGFGNLERGREGGTTLDSKW